MYELAIDLLTSAGIEQYEISNFAAAGFQCRHNLLYWANKPYLGIGPGAASYLERLRRTNIADIKKYTRAVENCESTIAESETLTSEEFACETAVLNLRRIAGIDLVQFREQTGFDASELFAEVIESNTKSGLLETSSGRLFLTRQALPIADAVLCDFAAV
jgi:oxygen-independent coproporphyrinogen-3 oxidase